jgi:hypothetical protein
LSSYAHLTLSVLSLALAQTLICLASRWKALRSQLVRFFSASFRSVVSSDARVHQTRIVHRSEMGVWGKGLIVGHLSRIHCFRSLHSIAFVLIYKTSLFLNQPFTGGQMDASERALQFTVLHRRIVSHSPTESVRTYVYYVIGSFHCGRDWFLWSLFDGLGRLEKKKMALTGKC